MTGYKLQQANVCNLYNYFVAGSRSVVTLTVTKIKPNRQRHKQQKHLAKTVRLPNLHKPLDKPGVTVQ